MKKSLLFCVALFILIASSARVMAATATLSGLTINPGVFSPPFASGTFGYAVQESDGTTSVTIKPTAGSGTIRINGTTITSGNSKTININPGDNTITITVTRSGFTTGTYTIVVTREDISYATPLTFYKGTTIPITSSTEIGDSPTYAGILPAGLLLNIGSGDIIGTPTSASAATNYTITATYSSGVTATAIINIQVLTPTISYTGSPFTYYRGTPISILTPGITNGTPASYSGTLPAGLTLNATTGNITGTPTTLSAAANYTITANYNGGVTATTVVNMQVLAPTISYTGSPYTYSTGIGIPTLTPAVTGAPMGYTISPGLPAGLSFSNTTGVITGTPTAVTPVASYSVTANYAGGVTASTSISITVNLGPPILSYTPASNVYVTNGTAITPWIPVNTGGTTTAFSIGPVLPTGLSFNPANGTISGTPTAVTPLTTYHISASNAGGTNSIDITITVNPLPPAISYTPSTNVYVVGTAIPALTPNATGGGPVDSYSVGPALPAGLTLNTATGVISGTPTTPVTQNTYTVTATNAGGTATAVLTLTVNPLPPSISYPASPYVFTVGTPVSLAPVITGGTPTSFISPALPPGLSFNTTTGVISGTPTAVSAAHAYVISADNAGGTGTTSVTISCVNPTPPVISYSPSGQTFIVGTNIGTWSPTSTGGIPVSYAITSGTLPDGLLFNTSTGVFTGTPTIVQAAATLTVTATNAVGSGTANVTITVNPQLPAVSYSPLSYTYTKGTQISPVTPVSSGGPITSYAISGALPGGLSFNMSTGVITGTPTVTSFSGSVTVTASNVTGTSAPVNLTFTVNNLGPTITYSPSINIFPVGAAITPLTPTSTGGVPSGYTITIGTLPAGLSFNTNTGIISGTPTVETATPANLTIKATNALGFNTTNVTISVSPHAPVISYTPSTNVYSVNVPIPILTPANSGGAVTGFSYSSTGVPLTGATLKGPSLMTIDATGNIYVANYNNSTISKYNSSGTYIGKYAPAFNFNTPCGLVFDSAGYCYVMDTEDGAIYKFSPTGVAMGAIKTGLGHPLGIAIDGSDNIYIATYNAGNDVSSVTKYSTSGALLLTLPNNNMNQADGVAVDAAGNIYVLNRAQNLSGNKGDVRVYSSAGVYQGIFGSGYNDPLAISIDGGGNVFVADSHAHEIHVYNSSGGLLNTLTGFGDVEGFVADADGNLFVSDFTANTVKKFAAQGGYHINAPLPLGLSFNNLTGQITGTPTGIFPTTTYTITAYNITGSGSTTVTLSCVNSYDWAGGTSTDWNTASNWLSGVVPGSTDQAIIGVNRAFNFYPNILTAAGTVNVGSIAFGNLGGKAPGLVVNTGATLNVSGAITYQSDASSGLGYTCTLWGAGTLNVVSISSLATTILGSSYNQVIASSVTDLNVMGNLALTSSNSGSKLFNSTFNIIGGITEFDGVIQTTNTAGSTSSLVVAPSGTATLMLGGATPLSGLSATGTNVVTFNNTGATINYSGDAQTVYTDASITGLSTGVSYRNIIFSGTGVKTANASNLNVTGDFTNTLACDATNYTNFSSPTVNFNGTTQSLAGGAGNGTTFYNVTFSGAGTKTMASGQFYIASSGVLTMSGTNSNTILAANGLLTLNSDLNGSATIAPINGPSITGTVNVQRYLSGGSGHRGYRIISSPVFAAAVGPNNVYSINYLQNSAYLTGTAGGGFDKVGNPTLYLYREDLPPINITFISGNWWGISAINKSPIYNYNVSGQTASGSYYIPVGSGYLFFFRGNRASADVATETQTTYIPNAVTLSTSGTLNQGQVIAHDWYTPTSPYLGYTGSGAGGNYIVRGTNLVGNPYASSIDWESFNTTSPTTGIYGNNISNTVWEMNPLTYNYDAYQVGGIYTNHGRRIIASGQGFFVVAINNSQPQLIFNESAKSTAQNTGLNLFMSTSSNIAGLNNTTIHQHLRLQMAMDSINTDDIYIGFNSAAKAQYIENEDAAYKSGAGKVGLASISSDNILLAINKMPLPGLSQSIIPLKVTALAYSTYKLNLTEQEAIPQLYDIWLRDNYKKDSVDIRHNPNYSFDINADTNSTGSKRFELILRQDTTFGIHLLNFTASKTTSGSESMVSWATKYEENYTHFTVERSIDGGATFEVIGGLASNAAGDYDLLDKAPKVDNKYRLRIEDLNGTITYSKVVTVMYANTSGLAKHHIMIYPNPIKKTLNLAIIPTFINNPQFNIKIANSTGTIMKTATTSEREWQSDVSNLMPGVYILQVTKSSDNSLVGQSSFVKL